MEAGNRASVASLAKGVRLCEVANRGSSSRAKPWSRAVAGAVMTTSCRGPDTGTKLAHIWRWLNSIMPSKLCDSKDWVWWRAQVKPGIASRWGNPSRVFQRMAMTDPALPDQVDPLENKNQDPVYQHCFTVLWMILKKKILTSLYALVSQLLLWLVMRKVSSATCRTGIFYVRSPMCSAIMKGYLRVKD